MFFRQILGLSQEASLHVGWLLIKLMMGDLILFKLLSSDLLNNQKHTFLALLNRSSMLTYFYNLFNNMLCTMLTLFRFISM